MELGFFKKKQSGFFLFFLNGDSAAAARGSAPGSGAAAMVAGGGGVVVRRRDGGIYGGGLLRLGEGGARGGVRLGLPSASVRRTAARAGRRLRSGPAWRGPWPGRARGFFFNIPPTRKKILEKCKSKSKNSKTGFLRLNKIFRTR